MKNENWSTHLQIKLVLVFITFAVITFQVTIPGTQAFSGSTGATAWSKIYAPYDNASPAIADVDNDGLLEVVVADTYDIVALTGVTGNQEWRTTLGGAVNRAPCIGDVDFDGRLEIIAATLTGVLYCLYGNGTIKWQLAVSASAIDSSPTIGDVDGDEEIEILIGCDDNKTYCIDGMTRATKWTFNADEQVRVRVCIGDLDRNGISEVVFSSKTNSGTNGKVYCLYGNNGTLKWSKTTTFAYEGSAVIGNVQGDANLEVISGSGSPLVCYNGLNGSTIWSYNSGDIANNEVAIADANNDGSLDVIMCGSTAKVFCVHGKNGTLNWTRNLAPGMNIYSCPAVGDVDGDSKGEVVVGGSSFGGGYGLYILNGRNGSTEWRGFQNGRFNINPVLSDVDQDSKIEILVHGLPNGSASRYVYCLIGNGPSQVINGSWCMVGRNERHEGNYLVNLNKPGLVGSVNASSGTQLTQFNFTATYTDPDNNIPYHIAVVINGTTHAMSKVNTLDKNFVDGCLYQYVSTLPLGANKYYFDCSDGYFTNSTVNGTISVSVYNPNPPSLSSPQVSPGTGYNSSTLFHFSVNYTDVDNNPPSFIQVLINSSIFSMSKANASDVDYMDGCTYIYDCFLSTPGNYSFQMQCSDGGATVSTTTLAGPDVDAIYLRNYLRVSDSPFEWLDATTGVRCNMGLRDSGNEMFSLPFEFKFYNGSFTSIYVSINGFVSFLNDTLNDNVAFPSAAHPFVIAPYMDNLETTTPCNIFVRNLTAPNRVVISWINISTAPGRLIGSFQVVLYETGEIRFNYHQLYYITSYECGINYGYNTVYYNRYTALSSYTSKISVRYFYELNTAAPTLINPIISPSVGDQNILRTFTITYTDTDNNEPLYIRLAVNGTRYAMHKANPVDASYFDGCDYHVDLYLQPGNNTCIFETKDIATTVTTAPAYIIVTSSNGNAPALSSFTVNRLTGWDTATQFIFTVLYTDSNNNAPTKMNIILNASVYPMSKLDDNDTYFVDGCTYTLSLALLEAVYDAWSNCSDGLFTASLDPDVTITVKSNPLSNYYMETDSPYTWSDMAGAMRLSMHGGSEGCEKILLPFTFKYYNAEYDYMWIALKGFVSFEATPTWVYSWGPMTFPAVSPKFAIAPFWHDLNATHPCNIYYKTFSSPARVVIEWRDMYNDNNVLVGSFQLVLYETGSIVFNYDYISYATDYSCGINHGSNLAYYNSFAALNASINDYSILFTYTRPTSTTPIDQIVPQNATTAQITWRLHADNGAGTYRILRNGSTVVAWQAWPANDADVSVTIDADSGIGRWVYQIEYVDALGIPGIPDTVNVDVNDIPAVTLLYRSATTTLENSTGVYIQWTIEDEIGGSGMFQVIVNGSLYQDWTSWTSGEAFTTDVNTNRGLGIFNYTLVYIDIYGLAGLQNVTYISVIDRPVSSHPADSAVLENGAMFITWTLNDTVGPGVYRVLVNSTPVTGWDAWISNAPLNIPVNTTSGLGYWNYTIIYNNSRGAFGLQDEVVVTVDDLPSGTCLLYASFCPENATDVHMDWVIVDAIDPGTYSIYVNGTEYISNVEWQNFTIFSTTVYTNIGVGLYNYTIKFCDSNGFYGTQITRWTTVNDYPELTNSPAGFVVLQGAAGIVLQYTLTDQLGSGYFMAYRNGNPVGNAIAWASGSQFSVPVDTITSVGIFNYTLRYNDSFNTWGPQHVVFITIDDIPQIVSSLGNISSIQNATGVSTSFTLVDGIAGGLYSVLVDGVLLVNNQTWTNNTAIILPIDTNRGIGKYNYTIRFWDSNGFQGGQMNFIVTILQGNEPPIPDPILQFLTDNWMWLTIGAVGLIIVLAAAVSVHRKKKAVIASKIAPTSKTSKKELNFTEPRPLKDEVPASRASTGFPTPPTTESTQPPANNPMSVVVNQTPIQARFYCDKCNTYHVIENPALETWYSCPTCQGLLALIIPCSACGKDIMMNKENYNLMKTTGVICPFCNNLTRY